MFDHIRADAMRVHRLTSPLRTLDVFRALWRNFGLQALLIYRLGRWLNQAQNGLFKTILLAPLFPVYWLFERAIRKAYGIQLAQSADIAPGLYIGHFGGIEVKNCRIGPNCAIQQQVKLAPPENTSRGPTIGEGVWIGAHVQIRGDFAVGDGATIGAGAVVIQDIPGRCLALGNPARVAQRDYDNQAFL
jgi:serine O-acetyltransferase